jgi:hypothetical protein
MPLEAQARNRLCARLQAPHAEFIQSYESNRETPSRGVLFEHDLAEKPVPGFPDHALILLRQKPSW